MILPKMTFRFSNENVDLYPSGFFFLPETLLIKIKATYVSNGNDHFGNVYNILKLQQTLSVLLDYSHAGANSPVGREYSFKI